MSPDDLSDEQLLNLVVSTDKELFDAGMGVRRRDFEMPFVLMKKLGYSDFIMGGVGAPKIVERIRSAFASIYQKRDFAIPQHIGVFMYRDVFVRIRVPLIFGKVHFNLFDCVDLTAVQHRMIQAESDQIDIYRDQFSDVFDVQYGLQELKDPFSKTELVVRFAGLARLHLHSAAAILTGGYDHRGAVQSALIATELALKAGAAAHGLSESDIKGRFGHNNEELVDFVGASWPLFDHARVKRVVANQPLYVLNRYSAVQSDVRDVGHLVMGAQYVVSEVFRQISSRDFRSSLTIPSERRYPA